MDSAQQNHYRAFHRGTDQSNNSTLAILPSPSEAGSFRSGNNTSFSDVFSSNNSFNFLESKCMYETHWQDCIEFNKRLDKTRGQNFLVANPEFIPYV